MRGSESGDRGAEDPPTHPAEQGSRAFVKRGRGVRYEDLIWQLMSRCAFAPPVRAPRFVRTGQLGRAVLPQDQEHNAAD